jgi:glycosyltransferase involved in cell wall biosynthesis
MKLILLAYNRIEAFRHLLKSLAEQSDQDFEVLVFLDYSEVQVDIERLVTEVLSGKVLNIISNDYNVGVEGQMEGVFRWISDHESALVLEDDLVLHQDFIRYARKRIEGMSSENAAMLSFYHQHFYHQNYFPFIPLSSSYSLQLPSSWGFYMEQEHAKNYVNHKMNQSVESVLPSNIKNWDKSWKKAFTSYLIQEDKNVLYADAALSGPSGASGNHEMSSFYASSFHNKPVFASQPSYAYDAYMELKPAYFEEVLGVAAKDLTIDLWGTKPLENVQTPYLISAKTCKEPLQEFDATLKPLELNVLWKRLGSSIHFGRTKDFSSKLQDYAHFNERFEAYGMPGNRRNLLKKILLHK